MASQPGREGGGAAAKAEVAAFWEAEACGTVYAVGADQRERYAEQARVRYLLEPFISDFARFNEGRDREVLEVGVGMGADHLEWSRAEPRLLVGIDLTHNAVKTTFERLHLEGRQPRLARGDAERLPLGDGSFDLVYSWGVIHHSPDTRAAVAEIHRVLRPGGVARVMVYQRWSIVGAMLWARYALLALRPWRSLDGIYARYLESPGTNVFSVREIRRMFEDFEDVVVDTRLSPGDLLTGAAGQRHEGRLLRLARALWPRRLLRRFFGRFGLFLMIEARKPPDTGAG